MEHLSLLIYNKYSENFTKLVNFHHNLQIFHDHIGKYYSNIHIFIFSNSKKNIQDEYKLRYIISTYKNYIVHFIKYKDELTPQEQENEKIICKKYYNNIRGNSGINNDSTIPTTLYHNYLLNKYKNEVFIPDSTHFTNISCNTIYYNCFDIKINTIQNISEKYLIDKILRYTLEKKFGHDENILVVKDILFMGNNNYINYLFDYTKLVKHDFLYHEHIWRDSSLLYNYSVISSVDNKETYSIFTQYFCRLFYSRNIIIKNLNDETILSVNDVDNEKVKIIVYIDVESDVESDDKLQYKIYINRKPRKTETTCDKFIIDNMNDEHNFYKYKYLLLGSDVIFLQNNKLLCWLKEHNYKGKIMEHNPTL